MKYIRFNTTWEEDQKERALYFAKLSYSEKLQYFLKVQKKWGVSSGLRYDLTICDPISLAPYR